MKKLLLLTVLIPFPAAAKDITGKWNGLPDVKGTEKDVQVSPDKLIAIKKAINRGGNQQERTIEFSDMNHLFQTCKTGAISEYANIEQTIDPVAMKEISNWVLKQSQ